jgi:hypothetical protein
MCSTFDHEASRRLPLADSAFRLLQHATDARFLTDVFQRHRGRSYQSVIDFPVFVHLVMDALLGHRGGSARQTFLQAQEDEALAASLQAIYGKLRRVPLELSMGLFAEAAGRLRAVGSVPAVHPLPASLAGFWVLAFDGKKLKYVAHRLKPLRGLKGNIYGGKLLVVQDLATQQAVAVQAAEDGEVGDNPLAPPVVERIRAMPDQRRRLWVGDRGFCDYKLLALLAADGDHFVVRHNSSCTFHADSSVQVQEGQDDEGRPYRDEMGWLGRPGHPHRVRVRKLTVTRPEAEPLVIVTSLEDGDRPLASDLLGLYRRRWDIETMFQKVVQTFDLRHLIGGTAKATAFQAMLCLLLYNITLMMRDYVAATTTKPVSLQLLFNDLVRDMTAWKKLLSTPTTLEILATALNADSAETRAYVEERLSNVWTDRWIKSPTRKQPRSRSPRAYLCGGHSSVYKIQHGTHREVSLVPDVASDGRQIRCYEKKKDV